MKRKRFVIIGAAGYIAPKHFEAIKAIGGEVIAVVDPNDNLEVVDEYFPDCEYFKSLSASEEFLNRNEVNYITICSPSFLHANHIEFALRQGCDVICESPLILSKPEFDTITDLEQEAGRKIYTILQYRYHPELLRLKNDFDPGLTYQIELVHHSFRGRWFHKSWKGDPGRSGGIMTTLGYHFFDALIWIFGAPVRIEAKHETSDEEKGTLILQNAEIRFSLSNASIENKSNKQRTLTVNNKTIDLNAPVKQDFQKCYQEIVDGKGFGTAEVAQVVSLLSR